MACTDVVCLGIFLACCVGLCWVLNYAHQHGEYARLFHGYNYEGQLCGVDVPEQFLYYCESGLGIGTMDLTRPICVEACPQGSYDIMTACPSGAVTGYQTNTVADRYCMPSDPSMLEAVSGQVNSNQFMYYATKLSQLPSAWPALAVSAVLAAILGYLFLYALKVFAKPLVCLCLAIAICVPGIAGAYLVWVAKFEGGFDGVPHTGNDDYNFYIGLGLCGLSALLGLMTLCMLGSMDKAVGCVEAACSCMFSTPTFLLAPVVEVLSKFVLLSLMFAGFLLLVSCGEVVSTGGMYRTFTYSNEQYGYLTYYMFMMLWVSEFITSVSQYVVAYAAQAWYFTPYEGSSKKGAPKGAIFTGYFLAGTVHAGSLLFGACLIAVLRLARMILGYIAAKSKEQGNLAMECIAKVLMCIVDCFKRVLEFVNKTAYIEMAINGTNFCTSAKAAIATIVQEAGAVAILHGSTFILQFAGIISIACSGGLLTWVMVLNVPFFNDPNSEHYVSDSVFVAGAAAVISAIIAFAFMLVFDVVADTMLFCFAKETQTKASGGEPTPSAAKPTSSFLACCSKPAQKSAAAPSKAPECTPPELRSLIAQHR